MTLPVNYRPASNAPQERHLAHVISQLRDGKLSNNASVTLTANDTTTVVTETKAGPDSVILFMPTTSNAAGEMNTLYVSSRGDQTFTITHSNAASVDRSFDYVVFG